MSQGETVHDALHEQRDGKPDHRRPDAGHKGDGQDENGRTGPCNERPEAAEAAARAGHGGRVVPPASFDNLIGVMSVHARMMRTRT